MYEAGLARRSLYTFRSGTGEGKKCKKSHLCIEEIVRPKRVSRSLEFTTRPSRARCWWSRQRFLSRPFTPPPPPPPARIWSFLFKPDVDALLLPFTIRSLGMLVIMQLKAPLQRPLKLVSVIVKKVIQNPHRSSPS